jgi:hypothetical protein
MTVEPCACGGVLVADYANPELVRLVVGRHNITPQHVAAYGPREPFYTYPEGPPSSPLAAIDQRSGLTSRGGPDVTEARSVSSPSVGGPSMIREETDR